MIAVIRRVVGVALALGLVVGAAATVGVPQARAAGTVSVSSSLGAGTVSATAATPITVQGSGFQSVSGGFGGIYVMFGWVDGGDSWRPSRGGTPGRNYLYVPDSETQSNQGYQRFVSFPGSSTAESANGGVVGADGRWQVNMVVPGPRFTARDRNGNAKQVDCLAVRCGIITVGAHGVANATNETFTPVTFRGAAGSGATAGSAAASAGATTRATAPVAATNSQQGAQPVDASTAGPDAQEPTAPAQPAGVGVTSTTVVVGRAITFSGRGFTPGEQIVASLSGGQAALGPLVAGNGGEVAGVLALPGDIRPGTHTLTLVGAASGQTPAVQVTVIADPLLAAQQAETGGPQRWALSAVLGAAALLLLLILVSAVTALARRRRSAGAGRRPQPRKRPKRGRRSGGPAGAKRAGARRGGSATEVPEQTTSRPLGASPPTGQSAAPPPDNADNVDTLVFDATGARR